MAQPQGSFSAPPQVVSFDGLLSDFDGTIVDSTEGEHGRMHLYLSNNILMYFYIAIIKHWHKFVARYL